MRFSEELAHTCTTAKKQASYFAPLLLSLPYISGVPTYKANASFLIRFLGVAKIATWAEEEEEEASPTYPKRAAVPRQNANCPQCQHLGRAKAKKEKNTQTLVYASSPTHLEEEMLFFPSKVIWGILRRHLCSSFLASGHLSSWFPSSEQPLLSATLMSCCLY